MQECFLELTFQTGEVVEFIVDVLWQLIFVCMHV